MEKTKVTKDLENKTLTIERTFNTTKEKLWRMFAEKDWFEKWWGPEGWETTVKQFDFIPGGNVHYGMKCVDQNQGEWFGQESWGMMVIESVSASDSFTYKDYFSDVEGTLNQELPSLTVTNQFIEADGKCTFVSRTIANSADDIEKLLAMGMAEGFDSQLNKLDKIFAEEQ